MKMTKNSNHAGGTLPMEMEGTEPVRGGSVDTERTITNGRTGRIDGRRVTRCRVPRKPAPKLEKETAALFYCSSARAGGRVQMLRAASMVLAFATPHYACKSGVYVPPPRLRRGHGRWSVRLPDRLGGSQKAAPAELVHHCRAPARGSLRHGVREGLRSFELERKLSRWPSRLSA